MNSYSCYYVCEAKSIQNFIFQGGQLKLAIGGSELIEQLPKKFFPDLLKEFGLSENEDYKFLSQTAGSARILFKEQQAADDLLRILPLALDLYAPGLDFVQTAVPLNNNLSAAMAQAGKILRERRNLAFPDLPVAGPLALRAPRTRLPAIDKADLHNEKARPIDASFTPRIDRADTNSLLLKIFPEERRPMARFVEEIADEGEYLAVLHADGNGLGSLVREFLTNLEKTKDISEAAKRYSDFSEKIETATIAALRQALKPICNGPPDKTLPFRLLVCAGDDVTLLLNGRHAIDVAEKFLSAFESETASRLSSFLSAARLTASAGIVFTHRKYPYSHAYSLCESLTTFAKDKTERAASAVAFHRVTAGTASDYKAVLDQEMQTRDGIFLTHGPYIIGEKNDNDYPSLEQLCKLKSEMETMPRGSLRGLIDDIWSGKERAEQAFERIKTIAERRDENSKATFNGFAEALRKLTNAPSGELPLWRQCDRSDAISTPLYDALELSAVSRKSNSANPNE